MALTPLSQYKLDGDFKIRDTASDLEHSDDLHDFKQDELAASTVTLATVRNKDFGGANADLCVPRQKAVHDMEFFDEDLRVNNKDSAEELDSENLMACNQVGIVPLRHVPFAETVEMVEFDPAVHATPVPGVEYDAPAQTVAHQLHAALIPVVEYDTPASNVAHLVHAVPAPVDEYDAPSACATPSPSMDGLVVKVVHDPQLQVAEKIIEIPQLQTIEEVVDIPEIQTVQFTENLDYAPDLEMTPAERTLRFPLADCEEAIEELSRAMTEGFSAVLDEFIENFDKPEGLSAVVDKYFEKFDEPVRKHESDEYVCGTWVSEKGESNMTRSQEVAVLTIQRGWRWMHKKIELRAASEERLQVKLRKVRRHLVQRLPVGTSAKKTEGLKESQPTLKDVEKEWRMLFNEELVTLEVESRYRSRDL